MRQVLLNAWTHRGWLAWVLWPVSLVYRLLVALRRVLYQFQVLEVQSIEVPVVVVGNVVAGGAGKTPTVISVVEHLHARGLKPGIVSRGYGRAGDDCREVLADSNAADVGDEPLLMARTCGVPVFVAPRRIDACRALLATYPDTSLVICDDGLQHYALKRDIEICVFDERGTGNGFMLPAGPLREPWPRDVDIVLHTAGTQAFAGYTARRALAAVAVRADGRRIELAQLRGQGVVAVAGIARPERFFEMLEAMGLTLLHRLSLPDHHAFDGWQAPGTAGNVLLCTEKDAVKLWLSHPDAWAVPLEFTPEPALFAALDSLLDAKLSSSTHQHENRDGHQTA
ncbi:MAG: tetraacyldisaccharide 4'-kinase [Burkholderiales bacterium]|nr:MAG: tetraacyldisaccharide 4'-kinase [Burkholderiales bacterium]